MKPNDQQDVTKPKAGGGAASPTMLVICVILVLLVLAYPLSLGPAGFFYGHMVVGIHHPSASIFFVTRTAYYTPSAVVDNRYIRTFYQPFFEAYWQFTSLQTFMDNYLSLWGVELLAKPPPRRKSGRPPILKPPGPPQPPVPPVPG